METTQEKKAELSKEVAEKYDLVGREPGAYDSAKFGIIDFTTMTLAKADQLVASGFKHLVLKQTTAKAQKEAPKA